MQAILMMLPTMAYLAVALVVSVLPDNFRIVVKGSSKSEFSFYLVVFLVIALIVAHCSLLWTQEYTAKQIAVAEGLQLYTWINLWFILGVTIQGGK